MPSVKGAKSRPSVTLTRQFVNVTRRWTIKALSLGATNLRSHAKISSAYWTLPK
jgi:hypothetical protein